MGNESMKIAAVSFHKKEAEVASLLRGWAEVVKNKGKGSKEGRDHP